MPKEKISKEQLLGFAQAEHSATAGEKGHCETIAMLAHECLALLEENEALKAAAK